jgi:voltage-gated potassium channel Kch
MLKTRITRQIKQFVLVDRMMWLMKRPVFWRLTIVVHGFMLFSAVLLLWLEGEVNPSLEGFTDALYWAVASATTVGYGDVVAVTTAGKWLSMALMVIGTLISAIYTALFAAALMKPEIDEIERELVSEEKQVEAMIRRLDQITNKNPD